MFVGKEGKGYEVRSGREGKWGIPFWLIRR